MAQGNDSSSFIGLEKYGGWGAIAVFLVDEPGGAYYGSIVAAPYVREIFEGIFSYYDVSPEITDESERIAATPFNPYEYEF